MKQILYLTNKPIFPSIDGGCMAMKNFVEGLHVNSYEIDHIAIATEKHPFKAEAYNKSPFRSIESVEIDTKVRLFDALKFLFIKGSYNIERFRSKKMEAQIIAHLNKTKYEVILLESLFLAPYIDVIRKHSTSKILLRAHNVEYRIWKQLARNSVNIFKKMYLQKLGADMKKAEQNAAIKVDGIIALSEQDAEVFSSWEKSPRVSYIPISQNQTTETHFKPKRSISFLGAMNWEPNLEAVSYIVNELMPRLQTYIPGIEFHLAGSFMNGRFPSHPRKGIVNHGFVEDSSKFLSENGVLVLPIFSASGVRMKLFEALSLGVPVVTTKTGAIGLSNTDVVLLGETTQEIIDAIRSLLEDDEKQLAMSDAAKNFIRENFSPNAVAAKIKEEIEYKA